MASSNQFLEKRVQKFVWDFSVDGGANDSSISLGTLPDNAMIISGTAHVITKPVDNDAGDDQTIALGYTGATTAFLAATAISGLTDGSVHGLLPGNFALDGAALTAANMAAARDATYLHLSGNKEVLLTIADDVALTAGKIELYLEYYITE